MFQPYKYMCGCCLTEGANVEMFIKSRDTNYHVLCQYDSQYVLCLFFCYCVSEQNAGGPGGSETSVWRQRRQEIGGRGDGGNLVLGDTVLSPPV